MFTPATAKGATPSSTFSMDDIRATFNITCCVLGIGSLSMARASAQASPAIALAGLVLMTLVSIYATLALSKCMLASPADVMTYSDLGQYLFGKPGRVAVLLSQIANCLMVPIAFLVLGGSQLLPKIFQTLDYDPNTWIPLMALALLPAVLIRSLKEGAWVALVGAAGAFFGDALALVDALVYAPGPSSEYLTFNTKLSTTNVLKVFGSFSLAFGAAVVIPSIQRDHANPASMTKPIVLSLSLVAVVYAAIGGLGYAVYGCEAPANLLSAMNNRELEILAMIMFLIHIMIGFAVLLHPALFLFERRILGFHALAPVGLVSVSHSVNEQVRLREEGEEEEKVNPVNTIKSRSTTTTVLNIKTPTVIREDEVEEEDEDVFEECCAQPRAKTSPIMSINRRRPHSAGVAASLRLDTPGKRMSRCGSDFELYQPYGLASTPLPWITSSSSSTKNNSHDTTGSTTDNNVWTTKERLQSYGLRTTVVLIQTGIAMILQSVFDDLADFCGATCIIVGCVILPVLFYYRMFRDELGRVERVWCWFIIGMSAILGVYTSILYLEVMIESIRGAKFLQKAIPKAATDPRQFCY